MAKKRKANRSAQPSGPKDIDPKDARLGPISTYEDVADSEDEFHMGRDLMLEDEPGSKRRKKALDDIELSDEEILGYSDDDDSDDNDQVTLKKLSKNAKLTKGAKSDSEQEEEYDEEDGDEGWWGASKNDYYNADNIETEAEALAEEQEAKRIQQKKYSKMTDEDFMFDGDAWAAPEDEDEDGNERVTEVLKELEVTDDMGPEERYRMLKSRYPEFEHLVTELQEQQPILEGLKADAKSKGSKSVEAVKYWVLGCYVSALASYFALLTSPARDASKATKPLDPSELRDHEIMQTLVTCREAWLKTQDLKSPTSSMEEDETPLVPDEIEEPDGTVEKKKTKKKPKEDKVRAEKRAKKLAKAKAIEDDFAGLNDISFKTKRSKKTTKKDEDDADSDGDFGEEETMDARTAAEKAARKKTLKFYTSQIAQKANKRAGAGRDAGGDDELPTRERLRDRQARLVKEAERRAQKGSKLGADLDDNSDDEDKSTAQAVRDDGHNEYYESIFKKAEKKKEDKQARFAAYATASKADRVVENEVIGEDGKRKINYQIEKNKGLTPRRKKEVRNPRVKRKMQYEAKQKKLASMKPVWKGGEPKGGYRGELSGINAGVVKSVKL